MYIKNALCPFGRAFQATWGLVTFTRDLAFYVRNFQKTSTLMDVWTCGPGHLEMSFEILCKFLVEVSVIIMILS